MNETLIALGLFTDHLVSISPGLLADAGIGVCKSGDLPAIWKTTSIDEVAIAAHKVRQAKVAAAACAGEASWFLPKDGGGEGS